MTQPTDYGDAQSTSSIKVSVAIKTCTENFAAILRIQMRVMNNVITTTGLVITVSNAYIEAVEYAPFHMNPIL